MGCGELVMAEQTHPSILSTQWSAPTTKGSPLKDLSLGGSFIYLDQGLTLTIDCHIYNLICDYGR